MIDPQFLADHWPLTGISLGETFQSYSSREVVQVHANEGEFVVKIESQPPPYETAMKTYAIYDFLSARHFSHIPFLLKSIEDHPLIFTNHQSVAVMEFIDGGPPEPNPLTWRKLGRIAAKLNTMPDFPHQYGIPTRGVIQELTEQANSHPSKEMFLAFIELLLPLLDPLRQGLIHGEINLTNSMCRRNGELVLIDWDECGTGDPLIEAGYPLLTVFLTEDLYFHQEQAVAFYQEYYGQHQPGGDEKELLFRAALLHALRYMRFANQKERWERICYAVAQKDSLLAAIF